VKKLGLDGYTTSSALQNGHSSRLHQHSQTLLYIVLYELKNKNLKIISKRKKIISYVTSQNMYLTAKKNIIK
jgi:hypothetical protein